METEGVIHIGESLAVETKNPENRRPMYSGESSSFDTIFWITVVASQIVAIICLILVIYWCQLYGGFAWSSNADLQFFYHPLLMVLGLILFFGDAILVYRIFSFLPKWILKLVHAALHFGAIIFSLVGLVAVFENHRRTNKPDMYSLHSWVGIGTFSFFCMQYVSSFLTFLFPGMPLKIRAMFMPFHTFFGTAIFILAVGTAEMGLTERLLWTDGYTSGNTTEGAVGNALGLFLIIFAVLVVFLATRSSYKRKPLPSEITTSTN